LQDYFANASMSRLGYGVMAVTGTVAGQLFNFLIGFGLNMVRGCWHNGGSVRFPLFGEGGERGGRGRGRGENVILDEGRKRNDSSIYSMIILLVVVAH
jgi:Ca2+/Na+ antiporter